MDESTRYVIVDDKELEIDRMVVFRNVITRTERPSLSDLYWESMFYLKEPVYIPSGMYSLVQNDQKMVLTIHNIWEPPPIFDCVTCDMPYRSSFFEEPWRYLKGHILQTTLRQ